MASVTITITDTPSGVPSIHTDFKPAAGNPCSIAQAAALDIIRRTRKEYGIAEPLQAMTADVPFRVGGIDIDAVHRSRDNVVGAAQ